MALSPFVPLLLTTSLALFQTAQGETPTPEEMETVCRNRLSYMIHEQGNWAGAGNPGIHRVQDVVVDGVVLVRCYSISPRGHVVVPFSRI